METHEEIEGGRFLQLVEERKIIESEMNNLKEQAFSSIPESLTAWRDKEFDVVWDHLTEQGSVTRIYEQNDINRYGFLSLNDVERLFGELTEAWSGLVKVVVDVVEFNQQGTIAVNFVAR